jgi:DNA-binding transcriptional ArsR family regulator
MPGSKTAPDTVVAHDSARARSLVHVDPCDVPIQTALEALADPIRRMILRDLAAHEDWSLACGAFELPVTKATRSHHVAVLRAAGLIEQRDEGSRRVNRLRRAEFDAAFPGLLDATIGTHHN